LSFAPIFLPRLRSYALVVYRLCGEKRVLILKKVAVAELVDVVM
jgi:hypothetical protein